MKNNLSISDRVRGVRGATPQGIFAENAGISQSYLSQIEKGVTGPSIKAIISIAKLARTSADYLLTGEGEMYVGGSGAGESNTDKFVYVPLYNVNASAGSGTFIESERIVDSLAFKKDWVNTSLSAEPKDLVLITAMGDSMEPTLNDGDLLLLDTGKKESRREGVYCFSNDEYLMVKRLQPSLDGGILVRSDNDQYKDLTLSKSQAENLNIIGKLIWVGRKF